MRPWLDALATPTSLTAGRDSPVSTLVSALEFRDVTQAKVGGHDGSDTELDDVTGYEHRDRNVDHVTISTDLGVLTYLGPQARHRDFGGVLVEEAEADAQGHDDRDDDRVGSSTREPRDQGCAEEQQQYRIANLTEENGTGVDLVGRQDVRPVAGGVLTRPRGRDPRVRLRPWRRE